MKAHTSVLSARHAALATIGLIALAGCAAPDRAAIPVLCSEIHPATTNEAAYPAAAAGPAVPGGGNAPTAVASASDSSRASDSTQAGGQAPALAVRAEDVLELVVVLDSVPDGPGSVLVRVDRLDEPGVVKFFMPPPTAAAAGMTLAPPPVFQGCATIAAVGIELRAPVAPRGKAWVRASTDRAVRVRLRIGRRTTEEPLLIDPGTSGVVRWQGA